MITAPGGAVLHRMSLLSELVAVIVLVSVAVIVLEVLQHQSLCRAKDCALFVQPTTSAEYNEVGTAF